MNQVAGTSKITYTAQTSDEEIVAGLRRGDEAAFAELVRRLNGTLIQIALTYVPTRAVAEEAVQETWMAVIRGINRFEGRSSLKTWVIRILMNRARTIGVKENRSIPFASAVSLEDDPYQGAADADRFLPADHPEWPRHWASPPQQWYEHPEQRSLGDEVLGVVEAAAADLSGAQREVLLMRDLAGMTSDEVCALLDISPGNQRVLLHRARARIRQSLEHYFTPQA
jgi:RNA polymerase sigma-70 factor (ECF subfamily)